MSVATICADAVLNHAIHTPSHSNFWVGFLTGHGSPSSGTTSSQAYHHHRFCPWSCIWLRRATIIKAKTWLGYFHGNKNRFMTNRLQRYFKKKILAPLLPSQRCLLTVKMKMENKIILKLRLQCHQIEQPIHKNPSLLTRRPKIYNHHLGIKRASCFHVLEGWRDFRQHMHARLPPASIIIFHPQSRSVAYSQRCE